MPRCPARLRVDVYAAVLVLRLVDGDVQREQHDFAADAGTVRRLVGVQLGLEQSRGAFETLKL